MLNWLGGEGLDFLSPLELERLAGLRFERRRVEWLLGRWTAKQLIPASRPDLARTSLSQLSILNHPGGVPYVACQRRYDPGGKPFNQPSGWDGCVRVVK